MAVRHLAGLARAGVGLTAALAYLATDPARGPRLREAFDTAAEAIRAGDSIGPALSSVHPGLAATLIVVQRCGAPAADTLEHLAEAMADDADADAAVRAVAAGPRATARLLALLPVFGMAFGIALGMNPLEVLVGTGLGRVCLVVGVLLAGISWRWSARLVRAV
ncbi:MAG: type II secretion system F family protein [Actinomycetales bacterium]